MNCNSFYLATTSPNFCRSCLGLTLQVTDIPPRSSARPALCGALSAGAGRWILDRGPIGRHLRFEFERLTLDLRPVRHAGGSDGYLVVPRRRRASRRLLPFRRAISPAVPPERIYDRCWSIHPASAELHAWANRADATCHVCAWRGELTAKQRIDRGAAIPVSLQCQSRSVRVGRRSSLLSVTGGTRRYPADATHRATYCAMYRAIAPKSQLK
jgi:hypothetical protein